MSTNAVENVGTEVLSSFLFDITENESSLSSTNDRFGFVSHSSNIGSVAVNALLVLKDPIIEILYIRSKR